MFAWLKYLSGQSQLSNMADDVGGGSPSHIFLECSAFISDRNSPWQQVTGSMPVNMLVNDIMRMRTPQKAKYVLSCFHNRYVADGQNYIQNPLTLCLKCTNAELTNTIPDMI